MKYISLLLILISAGLVFAEDNQEPVIDFSLEDLNGEIRALSEFLGKGPVLLDFWATWCVPCKTEMPYLQAIYEKYSDKGFTLLAISEDTPRSQSRVKPFIMSKRFTFPVLLDPNGDVLKRYQGNTLPFQALLDSKGRIIEVHQGYTPGDEKILESKIAELLETEKADEE